MKTIPFSIPEFEKRGGIGKCKVVTRSGEDVRILATDIKSGKPVVGYVHSKGVIQWYADGCHSIVVDTQHLDLLIVDETPVKYRPWTKAELAKLLIEKGPFGVRSKDESDTIIFVCGNSGVELLFQGWTLLDGTPCGVEESV